MLVRLMLDAVAVTAASTAVFFASVQVEKQELPNITFWLLLVVLIAILIAAGLNVLQNLAPIPPFA